MQLGRIWVKLGHSIVIQSLCFYLLCRVPVVASSTVRDKEGCLGI